MAHRVQSGTGNLSNTATWGGAAKPGNGDTFETLAGAVLTIDENTIVGLSSTSDTVAITNKGTMIVAAGVTLKHRGTIEHWNGSLTEVKEGAHLTHDSTASSSPTSTRYRIRGRLYPDNSASDSWTLKVTGTNNANRGYIDADRTGGALGAHIGAGAYDFVVDAANGLRFEQVWSYIDVDGLDALYGYWYEATDFIWSANCALWDFGNRVQPTTKFNQIRGQYLSTGYIITQREFYAPSTSGLRIIEDVYFGPMWGNTGANWELSGRIIFNDGITNYPGSAVLTLPDGVFYRRNPNGAAAQSINFPGGPAEYKRFSLMIDDPANGNATLHHLSLYNLAPVVDIHDFVVQCDIVGSSGDGFHNEPDCEITVRNGIFLKNMVDGYPPCVMMQASSSVSGYGSVVKFRHNTGYIDQQAPAVIVGETEDTEPGAVDELHSNILVREQGDAAPGEVGIYFTAVTASDVFNPAKSGRNILINITGPHPSANELANSPFFVGFDSTPLVFSVSHLGGDIQLSGPLTSFFVDPARDMLKYAVYRGLASSGDTVATKKAALLAAMRAQVNVDDPDYNADVGVEDMLDYIAAGWAPTDALMQIAYDLENDGWAGAVAGISAIGSAASLWHHHNC